MAYIDREPFFPLHKSINTFSYVLYKKLSKFENDLNSGFGIHELMALLSQDPWFHDKNVFSFLTNYSRNFHQLNLHYKDLLIVLSLANDLAVANTAFVKQSTSIQTVFKDLLRENYGSEINFIDFGNRAGAAGVLNEWFSGRGCEKVAQFQNLTGNEYFSFLNSIRFNSVWSMSFPAEQTMQANFYVNEQETIEVQMMRNTGEYYCANMADGKILKLPFADKNVSLLVVLPNSGVDADIKQIFPSRDIIPLLRGMTRKQMNVSLPKFKLDEAVGLSSYLKQMDLNPIFNANMFGIIDGEELTCGESHQKLYLEMNEGGAEFISGTISTLTQTLDEKLPPEDGLIIYESKISTEISNRFAKTKVIWRVKNSNTRAADANFKVILTETAFISEFVMEIEGKSYKSYIKEKEEAKNIYNEAVSYGQSAGLVEATTRDSKEFTVSVNLEPDSIAVFSLTYEEMLQRLHDQYELVLNICPGQIVDDLSIEVHINESRPLKFVKAPPLRSGKDLKIPKHDKYFDPAADIKTINAKTACVKFCPDIAKQKKMTHYFGNNTNRGLSGQFVVQYDVEREPLNGEVLLQDGYFIHFFAPNDLDPLPKYIIFVLDTSASMCGRKIVQLKDALMNILDDLKKEDMLSIVEFNCDVAVWDLNLKNNTRVLPDRIENYTDPFRYLQDIILSDPQHVSDGIRSTAKEVVQEMKPRGNTFMIGGLETGLYLVKVGQRKNREENEKHQPIIVFLTDGQPNAGVSSRPEIVEIITQLNTEVKVPIFSLSLGDSADKNFLRKLSLKNMGFSRHIYEAADTSLQLQDFYKQISCPLLQDVNFKYDAEVQDVTRSWFPIFFRGSELVVSGRYAGANFPYTINCSGRLGPIAVTSDTDQSITSIERLWAYLTVKQLLDDRETSNVPAELTQKAVDLALKYSFVTDVTSLVVVKPNDMTLPLNFQVERSGNTRPLRRQYSASAHDPPSRGQRLLPTSARNNSQNSEQYVERSHIRPFRQLCKGSDFDHPLRHHRMLLRSLDRSCPPELPSAENNMQSSEQGLFHFLQKEPEEFTVNRPFLIMLVFEKNDTVLVLSQGQVYRPCY